jgi:hypothetical protein
MNEKESESSDPDPALRNKEVYDEVYVNRGRGVSPIIVNLNKVNKPSGEEASYCVKQRRRYGL